MDSQYATGVMLAERPRAVLVGARVPTVVTTPRFRQRRPSVSESLTEPPLESSTMVTPPSCRPRANSSKSPGVSAVTIPTAVTQPRQFGSQAIQLNFMGNLRSSMAPLACAELSSIGTRPGNATQRAAVLSTLQPRIAAP